MNNPADELRKARGKQPHCHICGKFARWGRLGWVCPDVSWDDWMGGYEHA